MILQICISYFDYSYTVKMKCKGLFKYCLDFRFFFLLVFKAIMLNVNKYLNSMAELIVINTKEAL